MSIYQVIDEPTFSPWTEWGGFGVNMDKVCAIDDISLVEMLRDSILGQWGTARKHFQGTITEPMPHSIYNRLLDKLPKETRQRYDLKPEPVAQPEIQVSLRPKPSSRRKSLNPSSSAGASNIVINILVDFALAANIILVE